ncbi:MAG: SH3 domain-containing protein [Deltaproteobacteria bacterium]|nr:SH3 domain-containing protein [Deltaproteobacteria bacterium]
MKRMLARHLIYVAAAMGLLQSHARAEGDVQAAASADAPWGIVRVIAEVAEVKTGPGFSYRTVYVAPRGETLTAVERANRDYWYRVKLPDGTFGWVLGDQVLALNVDPSANEPPGFFARVGNAIFSPPALLVGDVGLSFSAGVLGGEGMVMFRPSVLLAPHLALEGFVGETVGEQLDVLYYGMAANLFVWPSSPVTPFFSLGGGGTWGRTTLDQFAVQSQAESVRARQGQLSLAQVGGGLLISFKKRITLRFDFRDHLVFDPNKTQELKEYSGGLAIFF